ncbi:MAG: hypothetical protein HOE90_23200 [Bacteriovoracaceae bacterium]|jgi:hypothetical protein|nr:hypothetical protein [Bacteriovoracaceae bacterium]
MIANKKTTFLTLALSMVFLFSCTKKREDEFAQGVDTNLFQVSSYHGKYFELDTQDELYPGDALVEEIQDSQTEDIMNLLPRVKYTTNAKLLTEIPFFGKPFHQYTIKYEILEAAQVLRVLKVAEKKYIHGPELTYAEEIPGTNLLQVPLLGYDISLKKLEHIKNESNEDTNRLTSSSANSLVSATHFEANFNAPILFDAVSKTNIYPADFFDFDSEWFYSSTIVTTNEKSKSDIGMGLEYDFVDFNEATRIVLIKRPHSIKAKNLNADERIKTDTDNEQEINLNTVMKIKVDWLDFANPQNDAGGNGLVEEVVEEGDSKSVHWKKTKFMRIDFNEIRALEVSGHQKELRKLEVTPDFISFNLYIPAKKIEMKFSFLKAHKAVTGKNYFVKDRTVFGYFKSIQSIINNQEFEHQEDFEKKTFINRFYPKDGKIIYHFTKNSSKELRPAMIEVAKAWNQAFKDAETGITFEIDESFDVNLGDIRYNALNILDGISDNGHLGFGPSIADPMSGEIISASANMLVNPIRSMIMRDLRNYILSELGKLDSKYLILPSVDLGGPLSPKKIVYLKSQKMITEEEIADYHRLIERFQGTENIKSNFSLGSPFVQKALAQIQSSHMEGVTDFTEMRLDSEFKTSSYISKLNSALNHNSYWKKFALSGFKDHRRKNLSVTMGRLHAQAKEKCPMLAEYIEELKESKLSYNDKDLSVKESCANKLLPHVMKVIAVHEIGHNLGLRHNFEGSQDTQNFYPAKNSDTPQVLTASTMDYLPDWSAGLIKPGKYDIAAIAWAYADKVVVSDTDFVDIDPEKSIQENFIGKEVRPKKFKFCTDEDETSFNLNPLCNKFDIGGTPLEFVENHIYRFNAAYALGFNRNGKISSPDFEWENARVVSSLIAMRRVYDIYRHKLNELTGLENDKYLVKYDEEKFEELLQRMKTDPRYKDFYDSYRPAVERIFEFLVSQAFQPDKYCIFNNGEKGQAVPFMHFQSTLFLDKGVTATACSDYIEFSKKHFGTFVTSTGVPVSTIKGILGGELEYYDLGNGNEGLIVPNEVLGAGSIRAAAMGFLGHRDPNLIRQNQIGQFVPNMLDEPKFRRIVEDKLRERLLIGQPVSELKLEEGVIKETHLIKFKEEMALLAGMFDLFKQGISVPDNYRVTQNRLTPYTNTTPIENPELYKVSEVKYNIGSDFYGASSELQGQSFQVETTSYIKRILQIESMETLEFNQSISEGHIGALVSALGFDTLTKDEFKAMSQVKFLEWSEKLLSDLETFSPEIKGAVDLAFGETIYYVSQIRENMEGSIAQGMEPAEELGFIGTVFEQNGLSLPSVPVNDITILTTEINEAIVESNKSYYEFRDNALELEAQKDLLIQIF